MAKPLEIDQVWQERILEQVNGLQYGQVIITVHDGRIVQIDRTERTRYDNAASKQPSTETEQPAKSAKARGKAPNQAQEDGTLRAVQ